MEDGKGYRFLGLYRAAVCVSHAGLRNKDTARPFRSLEAKPQPPCPLRALWPPTARPRGQVGLARLVSDKVTMANLQSFATRSSAKCKTMCIMWL